MATLLKIAVLNATTQAAPSEVQDWARACELQMNRDYFRSAVKTAVVDVVYIPKGGVIPLDAWWIAVVDNADMADALGYHDITSAGLPLGKVFVQTAKLYGEEPSTVLSHELLEMLGDAFINVLVTDGNDNSKYWAREVCDAVQAVTYDIVLPATTTKPARTIKVSDFVLQNYWNSVPTKRPYSFKDSLTGPVPALAPGGYMPFVKNGIWDTINRRTGNTSPAKFALETKKLRLDNPLNPRQAQRIIKPADRLKATAKKV